MASRGRPPSRRTAYPGSLSLSERTFRHRAVVRAGLVVGVTAAVMGGVMSSPAVAPPAAAQTDDSPGAPGYKPGPASVFTPLPVISRLVTGGASSGAWSRDSSTGLPGDQPVDPSAQAPKPGLGTQDFYPLERRALGDRMELLVNLANGNVIVRNKDLAFAGTGLNTAVNHDYNNLATNRGSFGKRWTMTTGRDVGLDVSNPNKVTLQGPSGYRQDYTKNGSGYTSPSGANAKLTKTGSGYELKFDKTKEKWNFDNNGFFTTQVDRNDNTITYNYNGDGTLASIKDTRGAVTTFEYDSYGRVTKMKDPTGYEYGGYTYDDKGQHTGFTDPSGKRVSYGYDDAGNLTSITDPNGNEYRLTYDAQRRVTSVDEPREQGVFTNNRAVSTYSYTSATESKETNPAGGTTTYTFDSDGRQTKAKDPLGREQSKAYTANSDVNTTTSVGGNVTTASFDPNNNLIGTQLPTGAKNAVGYTDGANPYAPTSTTDSEGRQTTVTYDGKGDPLTVKQAQTGQGITRTYNDNGTVKDSTDGNGNKTTYTYDGDGRLTKVTYAGPRRPVSYEYDSRSRLTAVTDGNGTTLEYAYDAADRVVQLSQRNQLGRRVIQQTDYDANGNKTANYFGGITKQFTYSPRNQVMSDVRQSGLVAPTDSVTYTYDAVDNLASLKDAGGTTSYRYNTANEVTEVTDVTGGVSKYTYDKDGMRATIQRPNGAQESRKYDKSKRLTSVGMTSSASAVSMTYNYTRSNGNGGGADTELLQSTGDSLDGNSVFSYDGSSRLTQYVHNSSINRGTTSFSYDKAGNMTGLGTQSQTFNASNTLTGVAGAAVASDQQGNVTDWSGQAQMTYSPTNQQTGRTTPETSFQTGYDTADNTQPNSFDETPAGGTRSTYAVTQSALGVTGITRAGQGRYSISRDPDGTPLMQVNPDGSKHYFDLDRQGSVVGSTNQAGARTAQFRYKPYGGYSYATGADASGNDNFIGFQGGLFLRNPANTQFGHRWYDPRVGQFTQPDPVGTPGSAGSGNTQDSRSGIGGPYSNESNAYNFANGSPCNNSDPTGLGAAGCVSSGVGAGLAITGLVLGSLAIVATAGAATVPLVLALSTGFGYFSGTFGLASSIYGLFNSCGKP